MTGKRFTDVWCSETGHIGITDNGIDKELTASEFEDFLNELHEENLIKLEIVDAFIRGLEDEKGIDSENVEFQCKMNFTIKVLNKLKQDMLDPTEFKRLKELR